MLEFELKKIKYFDEMSEETPCFTAEIWENGKKVAEVKNDGHGGGNEVHNIPNINTYEDVKKFDNMDIEAEIFGRVWLDHDIKRYQSKGLVLVKDGAVAATLKFPVPISKFKKHPIQYKSWIDKYISKMVKDGYQVVNRNL